MPILKLLATGAIAGVGANVTGYLITGFLFHRYQAMTPKTWRATESWTHYLYAVAVRVSACIGIVVLYAACGKGTFVSGLTPILRGAGFGSLLGAVTILPALLELALFVNWDRRFVVGLVLDWFVVCVLAGVAAGLAMGAVHPNSGI